jgi:hypothetical protein
MSLLSKGEKKISEMGDKLDTEVEKRSWSSKFTGLFKRKKKDLAGAGAVGDAVAM